MFGVGVKGRVGPERHSTLGPYYWLLVNSRTSQDSHERLHPCALFGCNVTFSPSGSSSEAKEQRLFRLKDQCLFGLSIDWMRGFEVSGLVLSCF